jgi:N-acetylneuraminic acid mutarotase
MSSFTRLLFLAAIASTGWLFAADGAWISLASMLDPRQEVGAAELNGKIYVVGGLPRTNTVQEFDPATNTWRIVSPLPIALDHTAAAGVAGKLYVMGGDTSSGPTSAVYEYDPTGNQWTQKASMPTARAALATVVIAGKIYAVGGTSSSQRELEIYDPGTNSWSKYSRTPIS